MSPKGPVRKLTSFQQTLVNDAPVRKHIHEDELVKHGPSTKILRSVARPNYREVNLKSRVYHLDGEIPKKMCTELGVSSQDNSGYSTRSKDTTDDLKKSDAISNEKMALTDTDDPKEELVSNGFFDLDSKPKNTKGTSGKELKAIKSESTSVNLKSSSENRTCPICQEVFPDNHSFTLHIREHNASNNNQSHVCKICFKKLSSASSLDRHSYVHSGEKPFSCMICKTTFTTNGNMHRHMRTHGKQIQSNNEEDEEMGNPKKKVCRRNVEIEKEEDVEMSNLKSKVYRKKIEIGCDTHYCSICTKRFISEESLQIHMNTHQDIIIECRACFEKFAAQTNHVCKLKVNEAKTDNVKMDKIDTVKMDKTETVEGFKDLNFIAFSADKFSVIAKEKCEELSRRPCKFSLTFECYICRKAFPCERTLQTHELTHDFCSICKCSFSSSDCVHKSKNKIIEDKVESDKDNFLATFDLKKVKKTAFQSFTQNLLKDEILKVNLFDETTETGEKEEDNKINIDTKQNFQSESSNDFADIPDIISLTSNATLLNMSASPSAAVIIIPEDDTMNYITESPINEKSNSILTEGSFGDNASSNRDSDGDDTSNCKMHKCKHCSLRFETMKALRGHARCHSQNGPHCCDFCPYKSVDKSTLSRHMRTHNGERPFKCSLCDYAFTTKANSHRHVKKKHKIPDDQVASVVVYNPNMMDSSSLQTASNCKDETVCKYCGTDFKHSRVLKHHLRSVNNSCALKPFTCRRCGLGFSTKNNCIRHISSKHSESKEKVKELIITKQASASNQSNQSHVSYSVNNEASTEEDEPSNLCIVDYESDNFQEQSNQDDMKEETHTVEEHAEVNENEQEECSMTLEESTPQKPSSEVSSNLSDTCRSQSDVMGVAITLIDLSECNPWQLEPLDLSVRAIDLSSKGVNTNQEKSKEICSKKNFSNSLTLENVFPEPPPAHSTSVINKPSNVEHRLNLLPVNSIENSDQLLTCEASPLTPLSLLYIHQSATGTFNNSASSTAEYVSSAAHLPSSGEVNSQNVRRSRGRMVNKKPGTITQPGQKSGRFICIYCNKAFTLKSNRERHVKNHHPEFARPARSRNYIPFLQEDVLKPLQNVSDATKSRLRSILNPKVNSSKGNKNEDAECISDLKDESILVVSNENMEVDNSQDLMDQNSRNDFESSDLASVPSLINTANSQVIKEYLTDANVYAFYSSSEKVSSSEGEIEDSKIKNSILTCEYCNHTFRWVSALDRHRRTHTGSKPYRCSECPVEFSTKSNRDRHVKKQCCDKPNRFWKNKELHSGHNSKWTSPDSKNDNQPQCNIENNFQSHEMISNDINRPHIVDQQQNDSLLYIPRNLEVIHGGATLRTVAHVASLRFQSLKISQQELECKFCQNTYQNNDDLTNHMKELHLLQYKMFIGEIVDPSNNSIIPWGENYSAKKDNDQSFTIHNKPESPDSGRASSGSEYNLENNLISNLLGVKDPKVVEDQIDSDHTQK